MTSPRLAVVPYETTTLDLLKAAAVVLMIADHVGLYFAVTDGNWLRILGRPVAVIFGFLIGFSSATRVPPLWIVLGLALTLHEDMLFPKSSTRAVDILVSLALTRISMPAIDRLHAARPWLLPPLAVGLALLAAPLNVHFEYATEVTIVALLGAAVRLDRGTPADRAARDGIALVVLIALSLISIRHFELAGLEAAAVTAILAFTLVLLTSFERRPVAAPPLLAPLLRFVGRNTLWIYAVHLVMLQWMAWSIMPTAPDDTGDGKPDGKTDDTD